MPTAVAAKVCRSFFRGVLVYSITGIDPLPRGCVTVKRNGVVSVGSQGPAHALNIPNRAPLSVREAGRINLAKYTSQRPP